MTTKFSPRIVRKNGRSTYECPIHETHLSWVVDDAYGNVAPAVLSAVYRHVVWFHDTEATFGRLGEYVETVQLGRGVETRVADVHKGDKLVYRGEAYRVTDVWAGNMGSVVFDLERCRDLAADSATYHSGDQVVYRVA